MYPDYFIIFAVFLVGLVSRAVYEVLKRSGRINPKNTPLFILILLIMCCLWTSWFAMCPLDPWKFALHNVIRWVGLGIFVAGLILAFGALIQLRGVENIDHLVTKGLFSKLRHPMYLGFIFWIFGWAIYHGAGISFLAGLIGIGNILYWRKLEENYLVTTYGQEYLSYRARTWF